MHSKKLPYSEMTQTQIAVAVATHNHRCVFLFRIYIYTATYSKSLQHTQNHSNTLFESLQHTLQMTATQAAASGALPSAVLVAYAALLASGPAFQTPRLPAVMSALEDMQFVFSLVASSRSGASDAQQPAKHTHAAASPQQPAQAAGAKEGKVGGGGGCNIPRWPNGHRQRS